MIARRDEIIVTLLDLWTAENNALRLRVIMFSHDIVEGAEWHHGRQTQEQHQLQPLRLDGPVDGLEDLELVEQPLGLLPQHESAQQERQDGTDRGSSLPAEKQVDNRQRTEAGAREKRGERTAFVCATSILVQGQ